MVRYRDRGVIVGDALVIADLHLGREHASNVEFAVGSESDMRERLAALLAASEVSEVVVAGDFLHSFDSLPPGVAERVGAIEETVAAHDCDLVVTPGNHDVLLDAAWDGPTPTEHEIESADPSTVVCHGHDPPATDADRYVIGHDHPAIEIEGRKRPCYLRGAGAYRGSDLLVLPTFNELIAGVTVNRMSAADFHSPLIEHADALRPIVRDEAAAETLDFPPLGSFRRML